MNFKNYMDFENCKLAISLSLTFYEMTEIAAIHVLLNEGKGIDGKARKMSSSEIWDCAKKYFLDLLDNHGIAIFQDQQRDTFIQYLYKHVRDQKSPINRIGQRMGFYFDMDKILPISQTGESLVAENNRNLFAKIGTVAKTNVSRENTLYSVLQSWLVTNQYQAADISSEKLNGRWGNPDVAGIRVCESFKGITFELATIEAKTSSKDWQVNIFEAVAHMRFANRAYFAYAEPKSRQFVDLEDIKYYSELYKIGVIKLVLEDADYDRLLNDNDCKQLTSSDVEIIEICSASFNIPQDKYQLRFCENLGIKSTKDLYSWGKSVH
ncbi:MAG: hypothetical protein PHQ58_13510 [Rhodoferax sp.]|uniref:hypothetical protein n=1 Tax=Rhodoferax sp. TaxID=50421 RepID=UPI00263277B8|nr:hypothetical protein [Rhodoferax sp.]MDD2881446.1 hypothetical protein [Rhodoferax sp.]